ncbi:uncharacterized protein LOC119169192 isoform X2 [Rhipicephalus microplus]|uniref:uncharacterized protein LOC119169192 isoform X2 n=1 Tax=Rhipicephalus microplus TaxID=6941 RepID=UPI003F6B0125
MTTAKLDGSAPAASKEAPTPGPTKLALLLSIAGDDALEVYNFSFDQGTHRFLSSDLH